MINILATIGPSSDDIDSIRFLATKTNLFRLNGSHNNLEWHDETIQKVRLIAPNAFILLDIPGIKPRTANDKAVNIKQGQVVSFGRERVEGASEHITLTKCLPIIDKTVDTFSVNDGQFGFNVEENNLHSISGRSRESFTLIPKKGINIPKSVYEESLQKEIYLDFIDKASHLQVDGFGLSFVQTGKLVAEIRAVVPKSVLVSKIENSEGYKNLTNIIKESDAVMIDRGDLAAEIGIFNLFNAVEDISLETKAFGKPLIMATENLESMTTRLEPSKSEVMSLGHSAALGADCIMLSEETAISDNFANTITWLNAFLGKGTTKFLENERGGTHRSFPNLWKSVENITSIPLVLFTRSGKALSELICATGQSKRRLVVVTNNIRVVQTAKLYSQDLQIIYSEMVETTPSEMVYDLIGQHVDEIFVHDAEIAAIYVSKQAHGARANNLTFLQREMFIS